MNEVELVPSQGRHATLTQNVDVNGFDEENTLADRRPHKEGRFAFGTGGIWSRPRVLNLEGDISVLYALERLMRVIASQEIDDSSAASPLFQPTFSSEQGRKSTEKDDKILYHFRPCHYFDYISGGADMGGIFALMLGVLRFSVPEAIERSKLIRQGLSPRNRLSALNPLDRKARNSRRLQNVLHDCLEEHSIDPRQPNAMEQKSRQTMRTTEKLSCQAIVHTTRTAMKGIREPYILRSYENRDSDISQTGTFDRDHAYDITLVDACYASLATPVRFQSVKIGRTDGFASLPQIDTAFETYQEVRRLHTSPSIECFLSISTRKSSDQILQRRAQKHGFKYERFLVVGGSSGKCVDENDDSMETWARDLVNSRRNRSRTWEWARYVGLRLRCNFCGKELERSTLNQHNAEDYHGKLQTHETARDKALL